MFEVPTFSINSAKDIMGCAFATAGSVVEQLQEHGLVREITGNERKRVYQNQPYVELFQKMTLIENEEVTP